MMVTIRELENTVFQKPNARQLVALRNAVFRLAPRLAPHGTHDNQVHLKGFTDALFYIGASLSRTANDEPDFGKSMSWWCDNANFWHSARGGSSDVQYGHIMCACLALGVSHTYVAERFAIGLDAAVGLAIGGGRVFTNDWLRILESGVLRKATPWPATPSAYVPGVVRAQGVQKW